MNPWTAFSNDDLDALLEARQNAMSEVPAHDTRGRWILTSYDPREFFRHYSALRTKPEYDFWLFANSAGCNEATLLYAVPAGTPREFDLPPLKKTLDELIAEGVGRKNPSLAWSMALGTATLPPQVDARLSHWMEAFEPDHSPSALLQAAFLARDAEEMGARGHGCRWGRRKVLTRQPFVQPEEIRQAAERLLREHFSLDPERAYQLGLQAEVGLFESPIRDVPANVGLADVLSDFDWTHEMMKNFRTLCANPATGLEVPEWFRSLEDRPGDEHRSWTWLLPKPDQWQPEFRANQVRFYTFSEVGEQSICRHTAEFSPPTMLCTQKDELVATGPPGYLH